MNKKKFNTNHKHIINNKHSTKKIFNLNKNNKFIKRKKAFLNCLIRIKLYDSRFKKFYLKKRYPYKIFIKLRFLFNFKKNFFLFKQQQPEYLLSLLRNSGHVFKNKIFILHVNKTRKNIFANYSDIFGNVIYKASSGFFYKKSLRKTFYATGFLLKKTSTNSFLKKMNLKKKKIVNNPLFYLNILNPRYHRGFRKILKTYFKSGFSVFKKITQLSRRSHNGVRKPKKRRK